MDNKAMPQFPDSYWRESVRLPAFPKLSEDITVDVAIVGAGISGITTAYLLAKEGVKVALIDAGLILNGTTASTTAKITAQHDIIYDQFIHQLGEEKARLYYEANKDALRFIRKAVQEHSIECQLTKENAYLYTSSDSAIEKLEKEFAAYKQLGIPGEFLDSLPIPVPAKAAVVMKDQAQFHPLQYLTALMHAFIDAGGSIYENTIAVEADLGSKPKVITRDGHKITCQHVIACSHFPFCDLHGFYFARLYAYRSYVLGVKTEKEFPGGMYLSVDQPSRSLRYTTMGNGDRLVLFGGENHKTGQGIPTINHYEALQDFAAGTFGIKEIPYRWSAQDLVTPDNVPYIGPITSSEENILVATGYRKWGMTNGTAAALLLRDLVLERDNPYRELYAPSRSSTGQSIKTLIVENADVAKHLVEGKVELIQMRPETLVNDEGAVVDIGRRAGAYRDEQGTLHMVETTCTHMGCEVEWNSGDRTWDCPCHGSRFSITGEVIEGPAERPLEKIEE
ncbi:FAD-dependent oxidoreductase [Aneurinibacillus sp. Ricciae_BoGa-3]|uniref:FAD-dependent oxidoreductase n=1 Tax=Aneurinibacillus sp. Ricciae_BoGa-3 TaxID=3022697 RepID=UPI00233FF5B0|nr:FAD-dependent oxidoreductase [Aneurinibacillus sp. Ricciae_BoGa-3]WCK56916.1 FAD-dependent oxidoreductase [Aneurinibacillus sp. Ricciae_BoGa-3]